MCSSKGEHKTNHISEEASLGANNMKPGKCTNVSRDCVRFSLYNSYRWVLVPKATGKKYPHQRYVNGERNSRYGSCGQGPNTPGQARYDCTNFLPTKREGELRVLRSLALSDGQPVARSAPTWCMSKRCRVNNVRRNRRTIILTQRL